ncbi:MAG TPA: hypothetical protein PKH51_07335 [Candidatus Sumerlaeota bacterium]|nr:hypothetical protein [Candidatus Sumerlaeota bacterium]
MSRGTLFALYPQADGSYPEPEIVEMSSPAGSLGPGPTDGWLTVIDDHRMENLKDAAAAYLRESRQTRVNIQFNAYLARPDPAIPRAPVIEVSSAYLNPAVIPGWRGIAGGAVFRHSWQ